MAVTITIKSRNVVGNKRRVVFDVTGPASYTTGGETLTLAQFSALFPEAYANSATADWTQVFMFDSEVGVTTTPAFLSLALDKTNGKIAFLTAGAQTTNATNLSAQTVRAEAIYGTGANA